MNKKILKKAKVDKMKKLCPVCNKHHFKQIGKYEICPICGWEDDPIQRKEQDFSGGANTMSLRQARKAYREKK